jgi:flagellum-specific peptidoglycan hydrolase FlgJ
MADQTPNEEFLRLQEETNRIIEKGLPIKKEELEHAEKNRELNLKINAQLAQTSQSLKALGKSALDGQLGVTQFNQGIDAGVAGFSAFTTALGALKYFAGPLGLALKVLTFGVGLAGKAFKTVNEQSEALFKSYQDLSKTGQSAAGGMTDVFNSMQKFGYGIKELDQMTALLKENSVALAAFGGTAATGSKAFADAASEIQRSDIGKTFQLLGKTPDDINRGMALFVKQQQQSGVASSAINRDLAQQSAAYIKNLDTLSKLTGDDAAKLQEKLDTAMAEDALNQTIYELRKKGAAGDAESNRLATEYENAARRLTGDKLKEFSRGVGGDLSAFSKTLMASPEAVGMIGTDRFTASGYIDTLNEGITNQREAMGELFKYNAGAFMFSAKEMSESQSRYATTTAKSQEELVQAQQEAQIKGIDPNTKAMVNARIEQMKTRDALQSLVEKGVGPATSALEGFSSFLNKITGIVPGTTSKETEKKIGGDGDKKAPPAPAAAGGGASEFKGAQKEFYDKMYATLLDEAKKQKVANPEAIARLGASQSAIETGFGKHTAGSQNYFGIKARPGEEGSGGKETQEFINGKMVTVKDKFRKYNNMDESAADYIKFLKENKRYKDVLAAKTVEEAIAAQAKTGYATDPNYGGKLADINARGQKGTLPSKPATQVASAPVDTAQDPYFKPFDLKASLQYSAMANRRAELSARSAEAPPAEAVAPVEKKETNPRRMTTADRLRQEQEKARALLGNVITREGHEQDLEPKKTTAKDSKNTMPQGEIVGTGDPAKISGANGFRGMLTGPTSGYKPDLTMHGTEQLTIKPTANTETSPGSIGTNQIMAQQLSKMDQLVQAFNNTNTQDMMVMQLTKLDELVRVMQNQVSVSTKILQQSR